MCLSGPPHKSFDHSTPCVLLLLLLFCFATDGCASASCCLQTFRLPTVMSRTVFTARHTTRLLSSLHHAAHALIDAGDVLCCQSQLPSSQPSCVGMATSSCTHDVLSHSNTSGSQGPSNGLPVARIDESRGRRVNATGRVDSELSVALAQGRHGAREFLPATTSPCAHAHTHACSYPTHRGSRAAAAHQSCPATSPAHCQTHRWPVLAVCAAGSVRGGIHMAGGSATQV